MLADKAASRSALRDWSHFIVQHTPGAVITTDAQGRITEFNPAAEKLTGFRRGEVMGQPAREILHWEAGNLDCPLDLLMTGQKEVTQELTLTNRSGQQVPVMISSLALRDSQGSPQGGAIIIRDLTLIKRLETERRHLLNMFAHDLRTPVVGVAGLIRRLRQGKLGPLTAAQLSYLETIDREMTRLEELITGFLEFARLDLRIMTPQPKVLQVEQECREVISLLLPLAEAKGMELKTDFPPEALFLRADPLLFHRVMENLLGNAIKYAPPHTTIWLQVAREDGAARFMVRDQGPGIPPADLAHLFEVFYRGQAAEQEPGFGLGLATVKTIIDAHGGRIWVDTGPERGTSFFFTLPLEPALPVDPGK